MNNIKICREKIDSIDKKIIDLLNERLKYAKEIGKSKLKKDLEIFIPEREKSLLKKLKSYNDGLLSNKSIESIYREIISFSISLEQKMHIGYCNNGVNNPEHATKRLFGTSAEFYEYTSQTPIFKALNSGNINYGVINFHYSSDRPNIETLSRLKKEECFIKSIIEYKTKTSDKKILLLISKKQNNTEDKRNLNLLSLNKTNAKELTKILKTEDIKFKELNDGSSVTLSLRKSKFENIEFSDFDMIFENISKIKVENL